MPVLLGTKIFKIKQISIIPRKRSKQCEYYKKIWLKVQSLVKLDAIQSLLILLRLTFP